MPENQQQKPLWRVKNLKTGREWEDLLFAAWEVESDPISDYYTVEEMNADDLFILWVEQVQKQYPNGLIPIYWSIQCPEQGLVEAMPFQIQRASNNNFLRFFTHPVNPETGERLNWLTLPVKDKFWQPDRADKGGFIQQATNWKPSILQPYVYLPALTQILSN